MNLPPMIWRILLCGLLLASPSARSQGAGLGPPPSAASVEVHVAEAGGGPIGQAEVKLFSVYTPGGLVQTIGIGGSTIFKTMEGSYKVEVRATGYQLAQEDVMVMGSGTTHVYITMRHEGDSSPPQRASGKPRMPEVPGKSRKELDQAFNDLRDNKPAEAAKHVEYALKHTKDNPEVQYVAALCALATDDTTRARQYLESAVAVYPEY
jgi:hypothetical protein